MKKEGKSENNWGSFDCGKILYWNEVPVITYCAALTSTGGKGGEWRQFGTKLSPSETQQSFLQAGKLLLNALGVPTLLCEPVCPAQLCCPGSANREMFMGDREAFCMETVQQGWVWQWQRERQGWVWQWQNQGCRGRMCGSVAGLALEVSTALPKAPASRSLLLYISCIWECECASANTVHDMCPAVLIRLIQFKWKCFF